MRIGTSQAHTCLGTGKGGIQVVALGFLTNKKKNNNNNNKPKQERSMFNWETWEALLKSKQESTTSTITSLVT